MSYRFAKIMSGGRAVDEAEQARLAAEHIAEMKSQLAKPPLAKTENVIDQRVAEEIHGARRAIEQVETALERQPGNQAAAKTLAQVDDVLDDLADIVDAKDRCDGVARAAPDLKRRLTRRSLGGQAGPCDNR